MKTIDNIAELAYEAICAIDAAKDHCEKIGDSLAIYALDKAIGNIDSILEAVENGEIVVKERFVDAEGYAATYNNTHSKKKTISAFQFAEFFYKLQLDGFFLNVEQAEEFGAAWADFLDG